MDNVITFIGAGNMARSLIAGLIEDETQVTLRVSDPDANQLDTIRQYWPSVEVFSENDQALEGANIVILAVKPQLMQTVCSSIKTAIKPKMPLVISIAAGIRVASLIQWLECDLPVVRCMPNTPALVQAGATGLYANTFVSADQHSLAETILRSVGIALWFDEEDKLDAVTAVSGSGPAYFFLVMEAMQDAAIKLGLKSEDARLLILQSAMGAAKLALESSEEPKELRQRVTSKGGTTEAAIKTLNEGDLAGLFEKAMAAAEQRAKELAQAT